MLAVMHLLAAMLFTMHEWTKYGLNQASTIVSTVSFVYMSK